MRLKFCVSRWKDWMRFRVEFLPDERWRWGNATRWVRYNARPKKRQNRIKGDPCRESRADCHEKSKVFKETFLQKTRSKSSIWIFRWISMPELHFMYRRHIPNFVWIRKLLHKLLCPRTGRTERRVFCLLFLSSKKSKIWESIKRKECFLVITILSLIYILRMWWESQNHTRKKRHFNNYWILNWINIE